MTASRRFGLCAALAVTSLGAVALTLGVSVSLAAPIEQTRFDEQSSRVVNGYCGDLRVQIDFHDRGVLVARPAGKERFIRYTASHHGGVTITNLATKRAFTFIWNYLEQDLKVTDNGDGTFSILSQIPGPETIYGPDGKRLSTSGGTMRLLTVIDFAGTPLDPSDDQFISQALVSEHGGKPQPDFDYCNSFHTLTG
jgi:hypothetical protein